MSQLCPCRRPRVRRHARGAFFAADGRGAVAVHHRRARHEGCPTRPLSARLGKMGSFLLPWDCIPVFSMFASPTFLFSYPLVAKRPLMTAYYLQKPILPLGLLGFPEGVIPRTPARHACCRQ